MRIFQKNVSFDFSGKQSFKDCNVNLTLLDVVTIIHGLEKSNLKDVAEAQQAVSICTILKNLVSYE